MVRKSRVRRQIKARHTRRRQVIGGGVKGNYITDVQFNKKASSFSNHGFNTVLTFDKGHVYYGNEHVGDYNSPLANGSYIVDTIEPSQRLYGKPFNDQNTPVIGLSQTKIPPKSNYFSNALKLVTPRSSSGTDHKLNTNSVSEKTK